MPNPKSTESDPRGTALTLMNSALLLLDAADEALAAVHLQHAIEFAQHVPIPQRWPAEQI
jgi:hypothetical protein